MSISGASRDRKIRQQLNFDEYGGLSEGENEYPAHQEHHTEPLKSESGDGNNNDSEDIQQTLNDEPAAASPELPPREIDACELIKGTTSRRLGGLRGDGMRLEDVEERQDVLSFSPDHKGLG